MKKVAHDGEVFMMAFVLGFAAVDINLTSTS
jgi:hypothetical protein